MLSSMTKHLEEAGAWKSVSELDTGKAGEAERIRGEMKFCTHTAVRHDMQAC